MAEIIKKKIVFIIFVWTLSVLISVNYVEGASIDSVNVRFPTENTDNYKSNIVWQGKSLVIIHEVPGSSSNDNSSVDHAPESDSCNNLNVGMCLKRRCKWADGKCIDSGGNVGPFPIPFPNTFNGFVELFVVMWKHPPSLGSPIIWQAFLVFSLLLVGFLALRLFYRIACICCRRSASNGKEKNNEIQRLSGKRLVLSLPSGRKIPIEDHFIDCTGDKPIAILLPNGKTGTDPFEIMDKIMLEELQVGGLPEDDESVC